MAPKTAPPTKTTAPEKPKAVQMTDRRFLEFKYAFGLEVPRTVLSICMEHVFASAEDAFVRMHDHNPGSKITGLPDRRNISVCVRNEVISETRFITGCNVEGVVILETPGNDDADIIDANKKQITDAIELYFLGVRTAFKSSRWRFKAVNQVKDNSFTSFPLHFYLKLA